jgi:hypothetical protein
MRLAVLLSLAAAGCVATGNSADNPNRDPPENGHPSGTARYWTVTDEATGEVLSTGCANLPGPTVQAAIGQRLVYEIKEEVVSKEQSSLEADWWCTDEMLIGRSAARIVDNLDCWVLPEEAPIRVDRWEAIPPDRVVPHGLSSRMDGSGYRIFLEVLDHGWLVLSPSDSNCGVKERSILQVTE